MAPNLNCICNSEGGQLFYGDEFGTAPLTEITNFPPIYSVTGGVVALHPYTVAFGNDGFVMWSTPGDPTDFTGTGAGNAYVTGQKIVRGMPLRGGPGNSPSGLLWSADSLIRMSYTGDATAAFQFDTISAQSSILSAQSAIEYDGIFYWIGTDRFLMFNGVVREVENNMNINFFFDNLNYSQRQKVFAMKVPRFGEIWWCFPKDDSLEPNHAIIFNVRENTWYDTPLPNGGRSAGLFPAVFRKPLMTGVLPTFTDTTERITEGDDVRITEDGAIRVTEDSEVPQYRFWVHEVGTDEIDGPVRSYAHQPRPPECGHLRPGARRRRRAHLTDRGDQLVGCASAPDSYQMIVERHHQRSRSSGTPAPAASAAQPKPTTHCPSDNSTLPSIIGSGRAARNSPSAAGERVHVCPTMARPRSGSRIKPGLGGTVSSATSR